MTRKPAETNAWLANTGSSDDELGAWLHQLAEAIAGDPNWRDWWSGADLDQLVIYPSPIGRLGRDDTVFDPHGSRLEVVGSSAELAGIGWSLAQTEESGREAPTDSLHTPEVRGLFRSLIIRLLHETGDHLGLGPPPAQLPG